MKEHKFIFLPSFSLPSSSSLLKVPSGSGSGSNEMIVQNREQRQTLTSVTGTESISINSLTGLNGVGNFIEMPPACYSQFVKPMEKESFTEILLN